MAPHPQQSAPTHRTRPWIIALIALCLSAPMWTVADAKAQKTQKTQKASKAHSASKRKAAAMQEEVAPSSRPAPAPTPMHACKDRLGQSQYSHLPCQDGGRQLQWRDPRETAQVQHSAGMLQRDKNLLRTMARDRQRELKLAAKEREPTPAKSRKKTRSLAADERNEDVPQRARPEAKWPRYRSIEPSAQANAPHAERLKP